MSQLFFIPCSRRVDGWSISGCHPDKMKKAQKVDGVGISIYLILQGFSWKVGHHAQTVNPSERRIKKEWYRMCLCVLLVVLLVPNYPETAKNPGLHFPNFALIRSSTFLVAQKTRVIFRSGEEIAGNRRVVRKKIPKQQVKISDMKKVKMRPAQNWNGTGDCLSAVWDDIGVTGMDVYTASIGKKSMILVFFP